MVEALLIGSLLAGIGAAAGIYTNKQNIQNNNARWSDSVELANTAHQREVADLRAAGLNPILSAGGSGAQTPSMATATAENPGQGFADIASTVANATMQSKLHQGDIAEQKFKRSLMENDSVKKAIKDKTILDGAPKNAYEAAYLGLSKGQEEGRSWWQNLKGVFETTPNVKHDQPNYEPLDKAFEEALNDSEAVRKSQARDEEIRRKSEEEQKRNPGVWEPDENGNYHFVPGKDPWTKYKKNNHKKGKKYA